MTDAERTTSSTSRGAGGTYLSLDAQEERLERSRAGGMEEGLEEKFHRQIRHVLSEDRDPMDSIRALLELGAEALGVENGHLVRIDPADGSHRIVRVSSPHPHLEEGAEADLAETYCRKVVAGREALAVENAPEQGWEGDPAYEEYELSTYLGAKVVVEGDLFGTACFVGAEARAEPVSEAERAALGLLVAAIRRELKRGRREEQFERTQARLEALYEESPDMISIHDQEGGLLDANPRLQESTGYDEEELADMALWDLLSGLSPEKARRQWAALNPGGQVRVEGRMQRKGGSTFPVEVHLRRLGRGASEGRLVAITHDITGRKKRERRLRRQKALFEKTQSLANIGAWEYVPRAGELIWTEQVYEIYGLPQETNLSPEGAIEFFHPDDRPAIREAFEGAVEEGVPYDKELRLVTAGGETRWVRVHGEAEIQNDTITCVRGTLQDITGRKRREEDLRAAKARAEENEELFHSVMDNAPAMIDIIDEHGRIETVSDHFEEVLGWTREDLKDEDASRLWELFYPDPERRQKALESVQEAPDEWLDFRPRAKDGTRVDSTWTNVALSDGRRLGIGLDIRGRKKRERKLRQLQEKYEALLKSAPDAIFVAETDTGQITEVNDAAAELLSASADQLIGRHVTSVHPAAQAERYEALLQRVQETPETISRFEDGTQLHLTTEENRRVPVEASIAAVELEDGEFLVCIFRDIRRRRKMQRRYEAIFNQTFQFTGLMEPDGTLIEANDTALEVGGLTEEDVVGKPVWEAYWFQIDEETPKRLREAVQRAAEGEFVRYEETVQSADGPLVIDFSIRPIMGEDGEVRLLLPEGRDITERKRREEEAERRARAMEMASVGMAILSPDGRYTFVNDAHAETYGYENRDAFLGQSWKMCYGDEELRRFEEKIMPVLEAEGTWQGEATGQKADGTLFDQALTLTMLEGGGIICVVRDITERKERERELRAAKKEAEEAARLKSAMLANMNHEIRTPLTSVTGFADIMREELEGQMKEFAEQIHTSGERLMQTLDSVLQLSKLESEISDIEREEVDLKELTRETAKLLRPSAEEKDIALKTELPGGPVVGEWNEAALDRIAENLIENAIKFTPEGGTVTVRLREKQEEAVLEVEDTGVGIAEPAQTEIFEAFQQESEGLGREFEGSGLGLSIVKRLVEAHGGTVEVESEKGRGSCFAARLPKA